MEHQYFELLASHELPELNTRGDLFRHRTGAQLLSLRSPDENKVFGITFKTPPVDSTGVAHILEHSVLCGSTKYPVKEPFVELLKGSLKTFLNAFTYPDRTCYPVASQNVQDFYNLIDVYLDAVFNPNLTAQVLQQEGWHYELERRDDPLEYKGVVFNEMKGAYSSPDSVLLENIQQSLFPDTTYGVDSGGRPVHIPDLTFKQFEEFHRTLYHPANARIYFYGDDDPEKRFALLEEYLSPYEPREVEALIASQPRFPAPQRLERTYAANVDAPEDNKSMVAVNWLLEEQIDTSTGLGLQILDYILTGTPASPLRKSLIDSGLGEDLVGSGMESELKQFFYSTGLRGVADGDEEKVEALVIETLDRLVTEGIDDDTIAAAMNTSEFRLRENNTGSYPRGLILMLRALTSWLYDRDPFEVLAFEASLRQVRERAENSERYFEGLIRSHILDNSHRTTIFLRPDTEQKAREEAAERQRLDEARAAMGDADIDRIIVQTRELKERQEAPDNPDALARLPRLKLSDLDREIRRVPIDTRSVGPANIYYHDLFTNGIVYADVGFNLRSVPQEVLQLVPLFGRALTEMGTEEQDYVQLTQRIGARTGGIWPHVFVSSQRSRGPVLGHLFLRGKAMAGQVGELFAIMDDVLTDVRLDNRERFLQMALEEKASEEAGIVPAGSAVAALRLRSGLDEAAWISEQIQGVSYLFFLRRLLEEIESDWPAVLAKLELLKRSLINGNTLVANATFASADRTSVDPHLERLISTLPSTPVVTADWDVQAAQTNEGLVIPAPINYVAKGGNLYDIGYKFSGSVGVITRYLRNTWLWDRVRVQGGAYGADCSFDQFSGLFTFASYRDPNLLDTLDVYDGAADFLAHLELSEDELTKAIIGTIGELDAYQLPDAKGYTSLVRQLTGLDDGFRQEVRDAVLSTTADDFRKFGKTLARVRSAGRVVVVGGQEALEAPDVKTRCALELTAVL